MIPDKTQTILHNTRSANEQAVPNKQQPQKARTAKLKGRKKAALQRIDKVLADRGVGTRSQTFDLAKAKRITWSTSPDATHEERTRIKGPSEKVPSNASLFLDGNLLPAPTPLLLVYHKPKFVLSVMEDDKKYQDQQRKHLGHILEPRYARSGMHPVGRLDYDTTGLILFSSDGKLTQRLLHPRRGVEKEYVATVQGEVNASELREKLANGVETTDGTFAANLIAVTSSNGPSEVSEEDLNNVPEEDEGGDETTDEPYNGPYSDVRLVVSEGKYRMVRRILANSGHPVVELRRERHGEILLDDLPVGKFRDVTPEELEWAEALIQ